MGMLQGKSHWLPEDEGFSLRDITLGELLAEQAGRFPDRPAIIFDGNGTDPAISWTYAELRARVDELARALIAIGIATGDRVAVMAPNCPEWVLLEYALARIGAVLVTVNPAFRRIELDYLLTQARISGFFGVGTFRGFDIAGMLAQILPDLAGRQEGFRDDAAAYPDLRRVIAIGDEPIAGALSFEDLLGKAGQISDAVLLDRAASVKAEDIAQIQYTSGTTGQPKGAMLSHRSTVNNAILAGRRAGYQASDIMVSAMPFFHTAGCVCNVMGMCAAGGCLVALESFDAGRMLDLIERYRGTITNAVPTMYIRMLQDPHFLAGRRDLSSWRIAYVGGTSIPSSLMLELKEKTGADPAIIMGMTECSPIITQTVAGEPLAEKVANAGIPLPHVEIRIADTATGVTVPPGQDGELLIRGFLLMSGYFDMPGKTAETLDADGWLHSGDLARMDERGHLRIVGRIKDMLIRGGENIYCAEIEDMLLRHPDIAQAQVVGVIDEEFGEEIFAFIIPRDGRSVDECALRSWCSERMSRHKRPRYIATIEAMPLTANGKVRKVELRERAAAILAEGHAA